jgi:hypothetical protein
MPEPVPVPALIRDGLAYLGASLGGGNPRDASWAELQLALPRRKEPALVVGLAALFGEHLVRNHRAFWFPQRETLHGFEIGFPDVLIALSPFELVEDALSRSDLGSLAARETELGEALSRVGAGDPIGAGLSLTPALYINLFDPGFVQFLAMDVPAARRAWNLPPESICAHLEAALASANILPQLRARLSDTWVQPLRKLRSGVALSKQFGEAPRLVEKVWHLYGTLAATEGAAEELWGDVAFPLLRIGTPTQLPAVPAIATDPVGYLLSTMPRQFPAPSEALLAAFSPGCVRAPDSSLEGARSLRLHQVDPEELRSAIEGFDLRASRAFVERCRAHFEEQTGNRSSGEREPTIERALALLNAFKRVAGMGDGTLCLRRLTGAELAAEKEVELLRRLLLTT